MKYLDKINSSLRKLISPSTCLKWQVQCYLVT
jgi:hypothetical protein